jgi:hypothetical protein
MPVELTLNCQVDRLISLCAAHVAFRSGGYMSVKSDRAAFSHEVNEVRPWPSRQNVDEG